jgi:hypothetical protein
MNQSIQYRRNNYISFDIGTNLSYSFLQFNILHTVSASNLENTILEIDVRENHRDYKE